MLVTNRAQVEQIRAALKAHDAPLAALAKRVGSVEGGRLLGRAAASLRLVDQLLAGALRQQLDRLRHDNRIAAGGDIN